MQEAQRCRETTRKGETETRGWCAPLTPSRLEGDQSRRACGFKRPNHRLVFLFFLLFVCLMAAAPPFLCPCGGILRGMHGGWELLFRRADRSLSGNFCRGVAGQREKKGTEHGLEASSTLLCRKVHVLTPKGCRCPTATTMMAHRTGRGWQRTSNRNSPVSLPPGVASCELR